MIADTDAPKPPTDLELATYIAQLADQINVACAEAVKRGLRVDVTTNETAHFGAYPVGIQRRLHVRVFKELRQ